MERSAQPLQEKHPLMAIQTDGYTFALSDEVTRSPVA